MALVRDVGLIRLRLRRECGPRETAPTFGHASTLCVSLAPAIRVGSRVSESVGEDHKGRHERTALVHFRYRVSLPVVLLGRQYPNFNADPSADVRRKAAELATQLEDLVWKSQAEFENRANDYGFVQSLKGYAAEQRRLAKKRKAREDATSNERRFVMELADSMLHDFGVCQPQHVKPLGALIGYEPGDRGWTRLIALAREKHRPTGLAFVEAIRQHRADADDTRGLLSLLSGPPRQNLGR